MFTAAFYLEEFLTENIIRDDLTGWRCKMCDYSSKWLNNTKGRSHLIYLHWRIPPFQLDKNILILVCEKIGVRTFSEVALNETLPQRHIECKHLHSAGYICEFCQVTCPTKPALTMHIFRKHKN